MSTRAAITGLVLGMSLPDIHQREQLHCRRGHARLPSSITASRRARPRAFLRTASLHLLCDDLSLKA